MKEKCFTLPPEPVTSDFSPLLSSPEFVGTSDSLSSTDSFALGLSEAAISSGFVETSSNSLVTVNETVGAFEGRFSCKERWKETSGLRDGFERALALFEVAWPIDSALGFPRSLSA
jgi:hypothetical protein